MDDREQGLIRRAQQGDRQAFADLYERYQPAIYNYLYYRVDDAARVDELTGEVFARMVQNIRGYRDHGQPFLAWLYTIARNLRIDFYRECKKAQIVPLDETLVGSENNPVEAFDLRMKAECLKKVLPYLTEEQQFVVVAKFVEGRTNAEIATLMGKPEGAIKSLQHRGLATLRRAIEKVGCYEHAN